MHWREKAELGAALHHPGQPTARRKRRFRIERQRSKPVGREQAASFSPSLHLVLARLQADDSANNSKRRFLRGQQLANSAFNGGKVNRVFFNNFTITDIKWPLPQPIHQQLSCNQSMRNREHLQNVLLCFPRLSSSTLISRFRYSSKQCKEKQHKNDGIESVCFKALATQKNVSR